MNMDNIMNNTLGLDDTFAFHCVSCGKCCKHREDILLTPRDAFRAAKHLDMPVLAFILTYCEVYIGDTSGLPIVRLRPVGKGNDCPMLEGKKCRIQYAPKPVVCALYPLGRGEQFVDPATGEPLPEPVTLYFKTETDCPTNRNTTVRKWLERFGIEENDTFQKRWSALCMRLALILHGVAEKEPDMTGALYDLLMAGLYCQYEMNQPFEPQFEKNVHQLLSLIEKLEAL